MSPATAPPLLALFEKRFDGDDSLLSLARLRFEQAGLGAELHAHGPESLAHLLPYRPRVHRDLVVHLPRGLDLLDSDARALIASVAAAGNRAVTSMVVHDQPEAVSEPDGYLDALRALDRELCCSPDAPRLCVEYAVGLQPAQYVDLIRRTVDLRKVGACVDIGHVGIAAAKRAFAERHPGRDVCAFDPWDPALSAVIEDLQDAVSRGREAAFRLTSQIATMGKGMHLHLHDGHPLSTASVYGVSDHMSFLETVPLPFEYRGVRGVETMFGPAGLATILGEALSAGAERVSFTLEIHATEGRRPLADAEGMFGHWSDKTNAERMNHWLSVLQNNARLARAAMDR